MLARGGSFGHPRQEECLCRAIHTPYLYIAHCFQHNDIYVYAQPFSTVVKKSVLRVGHIHNGKHFSFFFFIFYFFFFFFTFPLFLLFRLSTFVFFLFFFTFLLFYTFTFVVFFHFVTFLLRYTHIPTPLDDSTRPLDNSTNSTLHNPQELALW